MMFCGDALELGDTGEDPGKSFLFFLTKMCGNGMGLSREVAIRLAKQLTFSAVRCVLDGP
jgi:hypothetical protein